MSTRTGSVIAMCVAAPLGAAVALLAAETADVALLLTLPALIVLSNRIPHARAAVGVLFGAGFLAEAAHIAVPLLTGTSGDRDGGLVAYAAVQLAIGVLLITGGALRGRVALARTLHRRRAAGTSST